MLKAIFHSFLVLAALLLGWLAWEWFTFPDVQGLAANPPETTAFMELRKADLRRAGKSEQLSWSWVPFAQISPYLRRAVLVAEDDQFYEHEGVDIEAMKTALERDWKRKKITHGGSTITQQLAKNLYLSPSRNPIRKVREYLVARALEKHLEKKRILEIYLNVVEFGETVYGAEAASRQYFKKSASRLTPREAALLAGALPNPRVMDPAKPNKRLRARQRMILSRMKRWGYLVEKEVLVRRKPVAQSPETPPTDSSSITTETRAEEAVPEMQPPTEPAPPATETESTTTQPQ